MEALPNFHADGTSGDGTAGEPSCRALQDRQRLYWSLPQPAQANGGDGGETREAVWQAGCSSSRRRGAQGGGQVQIDFVMMRACQANTVARCARPLRTPFVPMTGMYHLPLLVSLPRPTRPKSVPASQAITASTVNALLREHPSLTIRFQDQVQQQLLTYQAISAKPSYPPASRIQQSLSTPRFCRPGP